MLRKTKHKEITGSILELQGKKAEKEKGKINRKKLNNKIKLPRTQRNYKLKQPSGFSELRMDKISHQDATFSNDKV